MGPEITGSFEKRAPEQRTDKLNPPLTPGPGIEPGPHWWKANTLTTAPSLLPPLINLVTVSKFAINYQPRAASFVLYPEITSY